MLIIFLLIQSIIFLGYSEPIPEYINPYSTIYTDKKVYSWTDKIRLTIVAPSWNEDQNQIDSIGTEEGHEIKISTREHTLQPYKLTETNPKSGIFLGEITLTGFLHDVDGDGEFDTQPRTIGLGPTNGFIESQREGAITISFEFADGVVLTHSADVTWNIGQIDFLDSEYRINESAVIRILDPDMNLNPESVDNFNIDVWSDSDAGGIEVTMTETGEESGLFITSIFFSKDRHSSGNRLFTIPSDSIYAKYEDRTLPKPYSVSDELEIISQSKLTINLHPLERLVIEDIFFVDRLGNPITNLMSLNQIQVVGSLGNNQDYPQKFLYLIQIKDEQDAVISLSWIKAEIGAHQKLELSQSWTPKNAGIYQVEAYAWHSFENSLPLSPSIEKVLDVR